MLHPTVVQGGDQALYDEMKKQIARAIKPRGSDVCLFVVSGTATLRSSSRQECIRVHLHLLNLPAL